MGTTLRDLRLHGAASVPGPTLLLFGPQFVAGAKQQKEGHPEAPLERRLASS